MKRTRLGHGEILVEDAREPITTDELMADPTGDLPEPVVRKGERFAGDDLPPHAVCRCWHEGVRMYGRRDRGWTGCYHCTLKATLPPDTGRSITAGGGQDCCDEPSDAKRHGRPVCGTCGSYLDVGVG